MKYRLLSPRNCFALAVAFLLAGVFNVPGHVHAARDPNAPVWAVLRAMCLALAFAFVLLGSLWRSPCTRDWRERMEEDYQKFRESNRPENTPDLRWWTWTWAAFSCLVLIALLLTYYSQQSVPYPRGSHWLSAFTQESGIWETVTSVSLFVSGAILIWASLRFRSTHGFSHFRFVIPCLIGLVFVVGAAEEESWGQHWIGFETPDDLKDVNDQEEANLHNLATSYVNKLFRYGVLVYIGLLPLLNHVFQDIRYLTTRMGIPVPPLVFAPLGIALFSLDKRILTAMSIPVLPWQLQEVREAAFAVMLVGIVIQTRYLWKADSAVAAR